MKSYATLIAALGLCLATLAVADGRSSDEAAVRAVVGGFENAWNQHDMDSLANLFTSDADFVNVIGMRWVGREAIKQAHLASHSAMFKTSTLQIGDTTIKFLKPDVAIARSLWSLSGIVSPKGDLIPSRTGILTHVLVKSDGHWLIAMTQNTDIVKPGG
jgi:uncharacterized protein (TIGR02246 family)